MLGPDFRIISANKNSMELLKLNPEGLKGIYFTKLTESEQSLNENFNRLIDGTLNKMNCRIIYKNSPENIITDSYLSRVTDKFSDLAGFLVISKENKGKKQLRTVYKITDREFNIIDYIISGMTYKQIAEKLSLSEKTVESHLSNIYNKIGINNKIELINIAYDFNLLIRK